MPVQSHPNNPKENPVGIELGPSKEDLAIFGGPEWVPLNVAGLDDIPFDTLDPLERELLNLFGCSIDVLIAGELLRGSLRGKRGALWLARKLAGVDTPDLAEFTVNARKVRTRVVKPAGAEVPPPDSSSAAFSEEKASATGSTRSSRGSGRNPATSSPPAKSAD